MYDKRALNILLTTFWKNGWKSESMRHVDPDDLAYAKSKRYIFDPVRLSHDQAVAQLIEERERADLCALSNAFLASLSRRQLDARSAIGGYAFASKFPDHKFSTSPQMLIPSGRRRCEYCGRYELKEPEKIDLNVLNFERQKWVGVRRDDPVYAWLDLSLFREISPDEPTNDDRLIMRRILEAAGSMPPDATANMLESTLTGALPSSKSERRVLIEILAVCGILQPSNRSGYFGEFTLACERVHTGQHFNDWGYPAIWWRGADGVNL
jgi:hypothetical protein